jgi:hypothetical protein
LAMPMPWGVACLLYMWIEHVQSMRWLMSIEQATRSLLCCPCIVSNSESAAAHTIILREWWILSSLAGTYVRRRGNKECSHAASAFRSARSLLEQRWSTFLDEMPIPGFGRAPGHVLMFVWTLGSLDALPHGQLTRRMWEWNTWILVSSTCEEYAVLSRIKTTGSCSTSLVTGAWDRYKSSNKKREKT